MMEGANLLILLERILSGRPGDAHKHAEQFTILHENLLASNEATKRAAMLTTQSLSDKGLINKEAAQKFLHYLKALKDQKAPIPPDLSYLTFCANPAAQRAAKFFHSLIRLSSKRTMLIKAGLDSFKKRVILYKNHQIKVYHELEIKVHKLTKVFHSVDKFENIRMQKALLKWKFYYKLRPKTVLLNCLRKAELRYFYLKYLTFERWTNETWVIEDLNLISGGDVFNQSLTAHRIKKLNSSLSINNVKISEILFFITNRAKFLQNSEFDLRVQSLSGFIFREKEFMGKLERVVGFVEELVKQRKQMPLLILNKWNERFVERSQRGLKFEMALEVFRKGMVKSKFEAFRKIQGFVEESDKEGARKVFECLVTNALNFTQGRKAVIERLKQYQKSFFQTKIKYTKSILTSVFKSTKNTQMSAINTWKLLNSYSDHTEKSKKVKKFIKSLSCALRSVSHLPLKLPDLLQRRDSCLIRCIILACKNLRFVLNTTFQLWLKTNRSLISDRKTLKKLVLYSLSRIVKGKLNQSLSAWKKNRMEGESNKPEKNNTSLKKNLKKKTLRSSRAPASNLANTLKAVAANKVLRTAFNRVVDRTSSNYAKKVMSGIVNNFKKHLGKVFRNWENSTKNRKKHEFANRLSQINAVKYALGCFSNFLSNRVKSYLQKWANSAKKSNMKLSNDHLRGLHFIKLMQKIPFRFLKISVMRIIGIINKIDRALENSYFSMKRKPKLAFDTWRSNLENIKKIKTVNKLKAEKLNRLMIRVPMKQLRKTFNFVIGTGIKIEKAMRNLMEGINKKTRQAVRRWKGYCEFYKQAEVELGFRMHKLCSLLAGPVKKPLRTAFSDLKPVRVSGNKSVKRLVGVFGKRVGLWMQKWKNKAFEKTMKKKFEDKMRGFKLSRLLDLPIKSIQKSTLESINKWKDLLSKAISQLALAYHGRSRIAFLRWKSFIDSQMRKGAVQMLKTLKIRQAFDQILKRTLREASSRMMMGASKMEYTVEGLINGLKGIPRKAIRRWNKVIVEIKEEELISSIRGHKIMIFLQRILRRTIKSMLKQVNSTAKESLKLRFSLNIIERITKRIPKQSFEVWKKFSSDVRNQSIIQDYNLQIVKMNLEKIIKRTMRNAVDCIKHGPRSVRKALMVIINGLQRDKKLAFLKWSSFFKLSKQDAVITGLKHRMLHTSLVHLCRNRLKDAYFRVIGSGDKAKGTLHGLIKTLNNIPKIALKRWNKTVYLIREYELKIILKAAKLTNLIQKITLRTLKDSTERIKGDVFLPKGMAGHLLNLCNIRKKRPKQAFDRWKKFCNIADKNFLLDQLRQAKLQLTLTKIATRALRDSVVRIMGEGNKIKGAFYIYMAAMQKRPKMAFDKWKWFVFEVRQRKLMDNLRSYKLKGHFSGIYARKLRDAIQRIIGGGNKVKGAIQNIVSGFKNIPAMALTRWSKFTAEVRERRLMDNFRSEKLKSHLSNLVRRSLRRTFKRICNDETTIALVKSMFRWLENLITNGEKICFNKWKDLTTEAVKQKLKNTIKGQALEKFLSRLLFKPKLFLLNRILRPDKKFKQAISLCSNKIRKKPQIAFNRLKSFSELSRRKDIICELGGEKLKGFFEGLMKNYFRPIFGRFFKVNEKVSEALVQITGHLKTKPKMAIQKWHRNVENLKKSKNFRALSGLATLAGMVKNCLAGRKKNAFGQIQQFSREMVSTKMHLRALHKLFLARPLAVLRDWLDRAKRITNAKKISRIKGMQLGSHLSRLVMHRFQRNYKKCQEFYSFLKKFKSAIRTLKILVGSRMKKKLFAWKQNTNFKKSEKLVIYLKSQKLRLALDKLSRKLLRDATQRIIGEGDKAKGALKRIIEKFKKKPKIAFAKWRNYLISLPKKDLLLKLRAQRMKEILFKTAKRPLGSVFASLYIDKNKIKGAINTVMHSLTTKPRQVIKRWKNAVQYIREKALIDFFRGEKLATFAEKIVQRTRNDIHSRVIGKAFNPLMVYLNLRWVQKVFEQKPRKAFNKWKNFIEEIHRKRLLSNIRSHKLAQVMGKASRKKLRDYVQRILGEGDKVKGAIKTMISAMRTKTKEAFQGWLKFSENVSTEKILKTLKSQQLYQTLNRILLRTMRLAVKRTVEDEDKVKLAINTVVITLQVKPRQVIKKWKQNIHLIREKFLIKDVQSEKLRHSLEGICKRTIRKSLHRITSVQSNSIIAGINLKWINRILLRRPKNAFDNWKEFLTASQKKDLHNKICSQKLKNALEKVPRKIFKGSIQRMIGEGDRAKGALKGIYIKINRLPQQAFAVWKKLLNDQDKKKMLNSLQSSRLAQTLHKILLRPCKSVFERISNKKNIVKEMIKNLLNSLKLKTIHAFNQLKHNTHVGNLKNIKKNATGKHLKDILGRLVKSKCSGLYERMKNVGKTSGVQKIERLAMVSKLFGGVQKSASFHNWKQKASKGVWTEKLNQIKGQLIKQTLSSVINSKKLSSVKSIVRTEKVLKNTFSRAEKCLRATRKEVTESWKKSTFYGQDKSALNKFKAMKILEKLARTRSSSVFQRLTRQSKVSKILSKLILSQQSLQKSAIAAFSENKRKKQLISKIAATLKVYKILKPKPKIMIRGRFEYWKNLEVLRLYRLKKKAAMKWIFMSSINYQNSFWKLKYVWNKSFKYFDPRHSLMYRKMSKIATNYQTRLKQYAHFKLVMYYKTMPYPVKRMGQNESPRPATMKRNSEHRALAFIYKPENIAALSRAHTPVGYKKAFSRAFTPSGQREETPERNVEIIKIEYDFD